MPRLKTKTCNDTRLTFYYHPSSGHAIKYKNIAHNVHNNIEVEIKIHFIEYDLEIDDVKCDCKAGNSD